MEIQTHYTPSLGQLNEKRVTSETRDPIFVNNLVSREINNLIEGSVSAYCAVAAASPVSAFSQ